VCNLYALTPKRDDIGRFFRASHNRTVVFEPVNATFPRHVAPVVRPTPDGEREIGALRWAHQATEIMPTYACVGFYPCKGCGQMLRPKQVIVACFDVRVGAVSANSIEQFLLHWIVSPIAAAEQQRSRARCIGGA
jgi:hypothetical protein